MSCRSYVLWGDVIRGCYRRHQGGKAPQPEESDREEGDIETEAQSDDPPEGLMPTIPVELAPRKTPRPRAARGETAKRTRGKASKKTPSSKATTKQAAAMAKNDSGGENFDIGGFTDLDGSESEVEPRPPKPTPVRQIK